jgi:hypothetical protein
MSWNISHADTTMLQPFISSILLFTIVITMIQWSLTHAYY